jgi:hypothetical protein
VSRIVKPLANGFENVRTGGDIKQPLMSLRGLDDGLGLSFNRQHHGRLGLIARVWPYQTRHDFAGAMAWPSLQLKALRNSGILATAPFTRSSAGECGLVSACCRSASGV